MNRRILSLTLVAIMALGLPAASAEWKGMGDAEPNTRHDTVGYNTYEPNTDPSHSSNKVYFNAFITESLTSFNPNVAATGSQIYTVPNYNFEAALGVWKDCNNDGYMGHAESVLIEYRAELLFDNSICPAGESRHNDGEWVTEFIWIGTVDPCQYEPDATRDDDCDAFDPNPMVIYSNNTYIWGDAAAPGEATASGFCPLGILPHGTTANTGMLIRYYDCFIGKQTTKNANAADDAVFDATGVRTGLRFNDVNEPQRSTENPLVQNLPASPFYNPFNGQTGLLDTKSEDPAFTTWDCTQPGTHTVRDPTAAEGQSGDLRRIGVSDPTGLAPTSITDPSGEFGDENGEIGLTNSDGTFIAFNGTDDEGNFYSAPALAPSLNNPSASYWDATSDAYDGTASDCDSENENDVDDWWFLVELEGDNEPSSTLRKENDFFMTFIEGNRGVSGFGPVDEPFGHNAPADLGILAIRDIYFETTWYSSGVVSTGQSISRTTLEPHSRFYYTWYAKIDRSNLEDWGSTQLPSPVDFVYGSDHCTSNIGAGAAPENGFECDPALWWKDSTGKDTLADDRYSNGEGQGRAVGETYQLRDTDCYDGKVTEGVYASLTPQSKFGTCDTSDI